MKRTESDALASNQHLMQEELSDGEDDQVR